MSRFKENDGFTTLNIGNTGYCITCGRSLDSDAPSCCDETNECRCESCDRCLDEDDVCWVNGEPYCNDCTSYCDRCDETFVGSATEVYTGQGANTTYVCDDCLKNDCFQCHECDENYLNEDHEGKDQRFYIDPADMEFLPLDKQRLQGRKLCKNCYEKIMKLITAAKESELVTA